MKNLIIRLLVNAVALAAASWIVSGITLQGATTGKRVLTLLIVAAIFGVVNAIVKPVVKVLSFPLLILTLGLLTFVINAAMLLLTSWITGKLDVQFHVDGFWSALFGALIISVVGMILNAVLPEKAEVH
ncbi:MULTISPECIES: phage holin family protein [unclassified Kribbella]|jgi:putative membrane protein|uniref:phage holin family protein n=1 Tax=unclassified Kribbella TaxID=2644121 RepID=UPI00102B6B9E|nr:MULTISPECIES: phage holin family protein [unclassified Kribbella]RZT12927.1 putative membrane protein [Kribbella sp. VKM Ac-2569]TDW81024.1 putative membrane protein [Kribbella sp. VKM Ac-2566]